MQLTRFTDYSLRVLLYVGRAKGRICTMAEIAAYFGISLEHLRKVVHRLARLGYLRSCRGRSGGLLLGRDADAIRLGEVIVAMEEDLSIIDCEALACVLLPDCALKIELDRAGRAFLAALNEKTLADVLGSRRMQRQFRGIEIAHAS
ncbi:MAG TPA: Rrf2 family transcriptional regulator [Burkholderiales bacterium]|nr:Rrf2 family transcriptional regulator [Burkholderiales bacterium]